MQAQHAVAQGHKILAAIDDVEVALGELGQALGILGALGRDKPDVDHGLSFKVPVVGAAQRRPVDKQLEELRETVRGSLPAPPPTPEEARRNAEVQESSRQWREIARGGVHIGGQ